MRVKTSVKSGQGAQYSLSAARSLLRSAGQQTAALLGKVSKTVASPKFWTWPF